MICLFCQAVISDLGFVDVPEEFLCVCVCVCVHTRTHTHTSEHTDPGCAVKRGPTYSSFYPPREVVPSAASHVSIPSKIPFEERIILWGKEKCKATATSADSLE